MLKQETRLLKQETDMLPRDRRKEAFRTRRERLDADHQAKERDFIERLNEAHESSLQRLAEQHREKIALMEKQFLQQKQQVRVRACVYVRVCVCSCVVCVCACASV